MKFSLKMLTTLGLLASLCLTTQDAEAVLASVKSTAMAATAVAHPIDALAGAYNPAGITDVGDRFDVGAYWVRDEGKATVTGNLEEDLNTSYDPFRTKDFYAGDFGITKSFCTEFCCQDIEWSLGFVAYDRNFQKTTYKEPLPLLGTSNPGLEYAHVTLAPILAVKINECHSLGIAFNVQVERFKANGLQNFDNALLSSDPGNVTNRGYDYSVGFTPTLGWMWHINDCLTVGLTYQPKTKMPKLKKYSGFIAQHGRLDIPQKIGAGIAWEFIPCATIAFDIEHIDWEQIKALKNNLLASDGSYNQLGSSDGPGFGFRNQMYYRVGLEYQLNECLTLRAGYRWVRTPFGRSQTAVNLLTDDCVESFFTCGATWNFDECNEISGLFAYGFDRTVNGSDSIPLAIPTTPAIPLGGGNVNLKERKFAVGISWGHSY